jgi:hypothetical protein
VKKEDDMAADAEEYMLTTVDNPWNPYTNWDEWYAYDRSMGYDTPGYLARIAKTSFDLSDADQDQIIKDAIDEIVRMNVRGIYKTITSEEVIGANGDGRGVPQN